MVAVVALVAGLWLGTFAAVRGGALVTEDPVPAAPRWAYNVPGSPGLIRCANVPNPFE